MLKKIKFKIGKMHCAACKSLIETDVSSLSGVKKINVDKHSGESLLEYENEKVSKKKIFSKIEKMNYSIDEKKESCTTPRKKYFLNGISILLIIVLSIILIIWIKNLGGFELLAKLNDGNVGYGILFIIGLLTGFHCVGMCGGLVVVYSAVDIKNSKDNKFPKKSYIPHFQYNLGRLISYTLIGGILGAIGSFFGINPTFTGTVLLIAGGLMVIMGLSFLTNLVILKKLRLRTPSFIANFLYKQKHSEHPRGPLIIGLLNGLMPCGPLQAMQLYALTTGSAIMGAMSMGVYALGTIPMMFGFGIVISKIGKKYIHKMIKFSGVLVILLGIIMFNRGLNNFGAGIIFARGESYQGVSEQIQDFQEIKMDLTYSGYSPNILYIKKDIPVRWIINVKQMTGCTNAIMIESLGIKKDLEMGENIIEFIPPTDAKEIKFSCWMRMVWGKFIVTEDGIKDAKASSLNEASTLPTGGGCNGSCGSSSCGATKSSGCGCGSN
jgi:uncharacterized protein